MNTRTIRSPLTSTIPSLEWTGSRLHLFIGMVRTSQRFVLPFSHVGLVTGNLPQLNDLTMINVGTNVMVMLLLQYSQ